MAVGEHDGDPGYDGSNTTADASAIIVRPARTERIERALQAMTALVPGTKGMGPRDRADRLHAELERRAQLARDALQTGHFNDAGEWVLEP